MFPLSRCICKVAKKKKKQLLALTRLSVHPHDTNQLHLDRFSWNFVLGTFITVWLK